MILDTTGNGALGVAIRAAIEATGEEVRTAPVGDSADLFMAALGCRAIVCAPATSLLDTPQSSSSSSHPETAKTIVRAANAPGVKLVVMVVPAGDRYADEELVLKKDGIPYVIVRCPPLVEELAEAANFHVTRSLWLARGKTTRITRSADLGAFVARALQEDAWQGSSVDVPSEQLDVADALERAARAAGAKTTVHATSPTFGSIYRRLSGLFGPRPPAIALYDQILSSTTT